MKFKFYAYLVTKIYNTKDLEINNSLPQGFAKKTLQINQKTLNCR